MATILTISSQVARGYVGLSAVRPILERLGHEVIGMPTVLLSNHPGHPHVERIEISAAHLARTLDGIAKNDWLGRIDGIVTGYLPTPDHVRFATATISSVKAYRPDLITVCDPIIGDAPNGLYLAEDAARSIRDDLVPLADLATPNAFELEWLTWYPTETAAEATEAARELPAKSVLVTSVPCAGDQDNQRLGNLLVTAETVHIAETGWEEGVPKGTGDALTAAITAQLWDERPPEAKLAKAVGILQAMIGESRGSDQLEIVRAGPVWQNAAPAPVLAQID